MLGVDQISARTDSKNRKIAAFVASGCSCCTKWPALGMISTRRRSGVWPRITSIASGRIIFSTGS